MCIDFNWLNWIQIVSVVLWILFLIPIIKDRWFRISSMLMILFTIPMLLRTALELMGYK